MRRNIALRFQYHIEFMFHFMSSQSQPSHHSRAGDAHEISCGASGGTKGDQNGCRQRLVVHLFLIQRFSLAVA